MGKTSGEIQNIGDEIMNTIKNNAFMLKYVAIYTPGFFFWTIVEGLMWGCIHSLTSVLFVKALFDKIGTGAPFADIARLVGIMAVFFIIAYVFHEWYWNIVEPKAKQKLHEKMQSELFRKAKELDLSCYDTPSFYTDFVWAIREADSRAIRAAEDFGKLINRLLSTAVIIGVLWTIDVWIILAICGAVAVTVSLRLWKTKLQFKLDLELNPLKRKNDYIRRIFYLADYAKEIRLSQVKDILFKEFDNSLYDMILQNKLYGKKKFLLGTIRSISVSMLFDISIVALLVFKIMVQKTISLGDFAASVSATWKLFWQISSLMDYVANFKEHSLYAQKFRTFLNYRPTIVHLPELPECSDKLCELSLENISFAYPGTQNPVLKNISLVIKPKEKIALVGYNGAGKSTLIKLILHLYDPSDGAIKINGSDIKNYSLYSYRNKFGVVFQDYSIFATTIAENVILQPFEKQHTDIITHALNQSGLSNRVKTLKNGIFTQLTREFDPDGANLSGGETQKIAIARIFAKPSEIIILDEPSSALDSITEYEINKTLLSAAYDKTVIFISHRLSTAKFADRIYMLEQGEIVEQGSHDELMQLNGKYAQMFLIQAEKYNIKEEGGI